MTDPGFEAARLRRRLVRECAARAEAEAIAEQALTKQYEVIVDLEASRAVLDETPDFVAITAASGQASYLNRSLRDLLGMDPQDERRVSLSDVLTPESYEQFLTVALPAVKAKGVWRGELALVRADGRVTPVSQVLIGHRGGGNEIERLSFIARDVTEQRDEAELLAHRSLHDSLTGLPNRRLFFDRLDVALARTTRSDSPLGVLFIDLDGFKAINDTYGHDAGDQVLITVAKRLSECMRGADTLARLGGDEFILLCEALIDESSALEISQRLIGCAAVPISVHGGVVTVGLSIGIALTQGTGAAAEELVRAADAAMYQAKKAGKGTTRVVSVPDR